MKGRVEVLVAGFGGQGVVRVGQIVGLAAVRQGYRVSMLKSHGTEQRGGHVRSQVVISSEPIDSPMVENPDYFCALSIDAYNRYSAVVKDGIIIYDPAFVTPDENLNVRQIPFNCQDIAMKELGRTIFTNTILLGGLTRIMGFLEKENVESTTLELIPKFKEENRKAFELGYSMIEQIT